MKYWILIIWMTGSGPPVEISATFLTEEACISSGTVWKETRVDNFVNHKRFLCVPAPR